MSRFGTDGIRGRWPNPPMDPETARRLGRALRLRHPHAPLAVVRDGRASGPAVLAALAEGMGGIVLDLGVLPTPALSALLADGIAAAGVAITASHNPAEDNGLKVLGGDGRKLSDEDALDAEMSAVQLHPLPLDLRKVDAEDGYLRILVERARAPWLDGVKVVVDAANGAASRTAPAAFRRLGAQVVELSCAPDGANINAACGAVHPEALAAAVLAHGADLGVALDGDADRCVLVDARGQVVDGDALLLLLARPPGVVGTVMSNEALPRALALQGIGFARTDVGDRFVAQEMEARGWPVGGEPSGHVLLADGLPTGDGTLTALRALAGGADLVARLRDWAPLPLVNLAVGASRKIPLEELDLAGLQAAAAADGARTLVRWSGTEAKLRILVEAPDAERARAWADRIANHARAALQRQGES